MLHGFTWDRQCDKYLEKQIMRKLQNYDHLNK